MKLKLLYLFFISGFVLAGCFSNKNSEENINPILITEQTPNDTDDPAIWYNQSNPEKSLILGTDKGDSTGGIFVFSLDGKLDTALSIKNLRRPNNIDIEYGFQFNKRKTDIAVFTERDRNMIRVIALPECTFIDNGGIPVFEDDSLRLPMGIALYKDRKDRIFAFVGRKNGPKDGYLYQYELIDSGNKVTGLKVRALGQYSGKKEIEAIAVDDELGYVYYSDEQFGIRQYFADIENGNKELSVFGQTGFTDDHEGISIYNSGNGEGYIIVSDQQANKFRIFNRQGTKENKFEHQLVRVVSAKTNESDGSEILNMPLNATFPNGIFVAMSTDKTFQFYKAEAIVGKKSFWNSLFN